MRLPALSLAIASRSLRRRTPSHFERQTMMRPIEVASTGGTQRWGMPMKANLIGGVESNAFQDAAVDS